MPVFAVTSVNTGTDELTAVGVGTVPTGLVTGDRLRLRNVGGAFPAATPALAALTDFFAVRTGNDTIKLSDTNAHALAGTNIVNLTGSGTGTTTIEWGLPYCLPTASAAAFTQIKSVNDNAAWSALVSLYDARPRNNFSRPRGPRFTVQGTWAAPAIVTDSLGKQLLASASTGATTGFLEIPFDDGDRIIGLSMQVSGNGTADTLFDLFLGTTAAGLVSIASGGITDTNRSNTWATLSTLVVTPTVLVAGNSLFLQAVPNAAGYNLAQIVPVFDRA
jgi:hypothetical protein